MLIKRSALRLNCAAVAAILIGFSGSRPVQAGDLFQKPQVLFMQQDRVVTFELTPPNGDQPLGGGVGAQVGTATGAMNFFRALMASFSVAVFTAILLAVLGRNISIGVEQHAGVKHAIASADMVSAFRYVFGAAGLMLASAAVLFGIMEERPLAGPAKIPATEPAE